MLNDEKTKTQVKVMTYSQFNEKYNDTRDNDVIDYLNSLDDQDLTQMLNDLIEAHNPNDIIQDILLEIGDMDIPEEKYLWVEDELKKYKHND